MAELMFSDFMKAGDKGGKDRGLNSSSESQHWDKYFFDLNHKVKA
jgi:hypothetical protein